MAAIYTLGIASKLVELHPRTIMNYEKLGFLKAERTPTNQRRFSNKNLQTLLLLKYLREEEKLNLSAIKLILRNNLVSSLFPNFDADKRLQEILAEV